MPNDSSTGGFVAALTADSYDQALDRVLQTAVVGIVGLAGSLVRPRWQPIEPNQPEHEVNWCAIGMTNVDSDAYAYKIHDAAGTGTDLMEHDETLTVLASFYGPASMTNCQAFRDGLQIDQNRETLRAAGIVLATINDTVPVPVLLAQKWLRRVDVSFTLRRRVQRTYPIRTLASASLGLDNEHYVTPISANP